MNNRNEEDITEIEMSDLEIEASYRQLVCRLKETGEYRYGPRQLPERICLAAACIFLICLICMASQADGQHFMQTVRLLLSQELLAFR
ncbi:MAG: hypothetical protein HUJ72_05545 [Blautia sp.]|nr:hypothetical protein [Blautia sp.]